MIKTVYFFICDCLATPAALLQKQGKMVIMGGHSAKKQEPPKGLRSLGSKPWGLATLKSETGSYRNRHAYRSKTIQRYRRPSHKELVS